MDLDTRVENLEKAQEVVAATQAGAHTTQAAVQAGMAAAVVFSWRGQLRSWDGNRAPNRDRARLTDRTGRRSVGLQPRPHRRRARRAPGDLSVAGSSSGLPGSYGAVLLVERHLHISFVVHGCFDRGYE